MNIDFKHNLSVESTLVSDPEKILETFKVSYWEFSKYFMKCHHCGYEQIIGYSHRIAAPRQCPKCLYIMRGGK